MFKKNKTTKDIQKKFDHNIHAALRQAKSY